MMQMMFYKNPNPNANPNPNQQNQIFIASIIKSPVNYNMFDKASKSTKCLHCGH